MSPLSRIPAPPPPELVRSWRDRRRARAASRAEPGIVVTVESSAANRVALDLGQLEFEEERLAAFECRLIARERRLVAREDVVAGTGAALDQACAVVAGTADPWDLPGSDDPEHEAELDRREQDLARIVESLRLDEEALEENRQQLAQERQQLEDELAARRAELELREGAVSARDVELFERERQHARVMAEQTERNDAHAARLASEDEARRVELERREQELRAGEERLARARTVVEKRNRRTQEALEARAAEIEAARRELDSHAAPERPLTRREKTMARAAMWPSVLGGGRAGDPGVALVAGAPAHLLFVPDGESYSFVERRGPAPRVGAELQLLDHAGEPEAHFVVAKVTRSPLPSDARDCAYLQVVAHHEQPDAGETPATPPHAGAATAGVA